MIYIIFIIIKKFTYINESIWNKMNFKNSYEIYEKEIFNDMNKID